MNLPLANISTYHILLVIHLYNAPYDNYAEFVHVYSFFFIVDVAIQETK